MNQNKKSMLLLAVVFILPVMLAKLALDYDWFNRGATNKGELLDPVLDFTAAYPQQADNTHWRLVYVVPASCDEACHNALFSINQVWLALGRETDRVKALAVVTEASDLPADMAEKYRNVESLSVNLQTVEKMFNPVGTDGIFIVDTLQNVILRYPLQAEQQQAVMHSREILSDVKKLLKLSRIG